MTPPGTKQIWSVKIGLASKADSRLRPYFLGPKGDLISETPLYVYIKRLVLGKYLNAN